MKVWIVLIRKASLAKIETFYNSADARQYLADEMKKEGTKGQIKFIIFED